ncbi:hypothetical protein EJ03DRAFT_318843 [Teratosphaeria nubilosa]|uniref:DUF974-domain-containing protein n=1 Tax=Teratosphaeria nubilosa TaxID=161662 RepID=A0A6G1L0F0_9PEZI|nr:hypothetical protein EJ03DRAFT_318843 [Teratosphaeria nubilosa]
MASHQRTASQLPGGTHALSLKVLRLSRPSLATQTPLPPTKFGDRLDISPKASLAYPFTSPDESPSSFPLTPLLTLPAAFGAAYVGETFVCTLCVNNEAQDGDGRSISNVKISAELQTPNNQGGQTLDLEKAQDADRDEEADLAAGGTLQSTLRHDLKEEGAHVLAVMVTYTETSVQECSADKCRVRSFRKLYQFVSQQLIAVRSKVTERKRLEKQDAFRQWILEAQLENVGETSAVLEKVWLQERDGVVSQAVNGGCEGGKDAVVLKPQDVEQVMFVLEKEKELEVVTGQRVPLAQLSIDWRSAMGERGSLTTGWLGGRAT